MSSSAWKLVVLGIAQDGGMPHPGCRRPPCSEARAGRRRAEKVACLGLRHGETGDAYLFDATPDFPAQLHALTGGRPPTALFLTHVHVGHYTGLMYLGKEALGARAVLVYATPRMAEFLCANAPWNRLLLDGNMALRELPPDRTLDLPGGARVTPFAVPHRNELSDTVGYRIDGPQRRALFLPDIDRWEDWDRDIRALAEEVDLAFLDGTFQSADELAGRDMSQVPHPLMSETRARLRGARARVLFLHLNHTNPALVEGEDVAREGMEFEL